MATILYRTAVIYLLLSVTVRVMGKRQVGELEVSELISTFLLSEVAALPIADPEIPLLFALIPLLFILSLELLITCLKNRFPTLKPVFEAASTELIRDGKIDQAALKAVRLSIDELLGELRMQGITDPRDVALGTLESNGHFSVVLREEASPITAGFCRGEPAGILTPVILDGVRDGEAIGKIPGGDDAAKAILSREEVNEKDVFLLSLGEKGRYLLIPKEGEKSGWRGRAWRKASRRS